MTKEEVIDTLDEMRLRYLLLETDDVTTEDLEALYTAISMLQNATVWIPCSERMPTEEDADVHGNLNVQWSDGVTGWECLADVVSGEYDIIYWSRITPIERAEG